MLRSLGSPLGAAWPLVERPRAVVWCDSNPPVSPTNAHEPDPIVARSWDRNVMMTRRKLVLTGGFRLNLPLKQLTRYAAITRTHTEPELWNVGQA